MGNSKADRVHVPRGWPWWSWLGVVLVTGALTALSARGTVRWVDWTRGGVRYEVWVEQARVGFVVSDAAMHKGVWGGLGHLKGVRFRPQQAVAEIQHGSVVMRSNGVLVPIWMIGALVLGVVTLVWWKRVGRVVPGACPVCGYAMEGIEGSVCPECGAGSDG